MGLKPELNFSQLEDLDKAYLAGLFDGEGCANPTFASKKYFSSKEQKKKIYHWPRVQFVISNKNRLLLELVKRMVGLGGLYRSKESKVWDLRITKPKQVLNMINALLPYVKLKNENLLVLKEASLFISKHKPRSRWAREELKFFYENYVKKLGTSQKGRPITHKRDFG